MFFCNRLQSCSVNIFGLRQTTVLLSLGKKTLEGSRFSAQLSWQQIQLSRSGRKCVSHIYWDAQNVPWLLSWSVLYMFVVIQYHPCLLWKAPSALWYLVFLHNVRKALADEGQNSTSFLHVLFVDSYFYWTCGQSCN